MTIRTLDAALMPPDAVPLATPAEEYLAAELAKLSWAEASQLCAAANYAVVLHGELSLREMQIVCEVAAMMRLGGK